MFTVGVKVTFEKGSEPFGLLLHFTEEPTMAEVTSLVRSSVIGGAPHSWFVHELNRSTTDAQEWNDRQAGRVTAPPSLAIVASK